MLNVQESYCTNEVLNTTMIQSLVLTSEPKGGCHRKRRRTHISAGACCPQQAGSWHDTRPLPLGPASRTRELTPVSLTGARE